MKKLLKGMVIGAAILGLAGTAGAAEYTVNMCGASAQAGFWAKSGAAVVQTALNCTGGAVLDGLGDKQLIVRGLNCTADGTGTNDDTVYVRYQSVNSGHGCQNFDCATTSPWPVASSCAFTGGYTCTSSESAPCQLGCADVDCNSLTATTYGYEDGRSGSPLYGGSDPFTLHGNAAGYPINPTDDWRGVVVPFGFIANNQVKHWVCTAPDRDDLEADQHLAYSKENWQCDPADNTAEGYNEWCQGNYKCLDTDESGTGVCMDGNQDADLDATFTGNEIECEDASECQIPIEDTKCELKPLDNVSRLMVLHIFSDAVYSWNDFGPSFPSLAIVKCMRHGGSGTHQTLINTVFRGDATLKNVTVMAPPPFADFGTDGKSYVWHYKSSSDLTRDCVAYYAGGIGYVDADKVLFRSKIGPTEEPSGHTSDGGIHQLMYQGIEPSRLAVANGKYNFWAAQYCFANTDNTESQGGCYDDAGNEASILNSIMAEAGNPTYLTPANYGQRAYFWATQNEMQVEKANEYAYPTRK